jgi:3-oxoacyl-[acyl-carrier-protein] synthase-1/3-oxoacyl-[acyl-carrier-protein] synthase II
MISDPEPCRPFDRRRAGLNLGEGAAVFVLESRASLEARGAVARAAVLGYGASADAYHPTAPDPSGRGLELALDEALATSGLGPGDIAFVNAHGTGTSDNDRTESQVLARRFPEVPYLSTKGCTGHTLGAAGAIEAAFTVALLERGELPPSAGFENPDEEAPGSPVRETTAFEGSVALSQTLAFGGNNAVLVLARGNRP